MPTGESSTPPRSRHGQSAERHLSAARRRIPSQCGSLVVTGTPPQMTLPHAGPGQGGCTALCRGAAVAARTAAVSTEAYGPVHALSAADATIDYLATRVYFAGPQRCTGRTEDGCPGPWHRSPRTPSTPELAHVTYLHRSPAEGGVSSPSGPLSRLRHARLLCPATSVPERTRQEGGAQTPRCQQVSTGIVRWKRFPDALVTLSVYGESGTQSFWRRRGLPTRSGRLPAGPVERDLFLNSGRRTGGS
jgi:hypothetical protein